MENQEEPIQFADALVPFFQSVEKEPRKYLHEWVIYSNLQAFIKQHNIADSPAILAELTTWEFLENYTEKPSIWNTYYQPAVYLKEGDNVRQSPDIKKLIPPIFDYWVLRANSVSHPLLRARYSGLVGDFSRKAIERKPTIDIIRHYIHSIITIYNDHFADSNTIRRAKISQALYWASQYNQQHLIAEIKGLILNNDASIPVTETKNHWAASFDLLLNRKPAMVSVDEETSVVELLELRLAALEKLDPWASKAAVERLAGYYQKRNLGNDVKRVLHILGRSFDHHIDKVPAIQASGNLQELMLVYRFFQLNDEAEAIMIRIRAISKNADDQFKKVSVSQTLETDEFVAYAEKVLKYDSDVMFARIIKAQSMELSELERDLDQYVQRNPIRYHVTTSIVDGKNRVLAKINPITEDRDGHLINHYYRTLNMNAAVLLHFIFKVGIREHKLTVTTIMEFLRKSCIIEKGRFNLIEMGVRAYFDLNYVVCIHLLIPQFEESLRNLLEANGGNILTYRDHTYPVKTFNHVVNDEIVVKAFGQDLVYYFKMLFTDPRGWNLRNQVAHGLLEAELFNQQTAERLLHAFFCLGMIRWKLVPAD